MKVSKLIHLSSVRHNQQSNKDATSPPTFVYASSSRLVLKHIQSFSSKTALSYEHIGHHGIVSAVKWSSR